MKKCILVFTGVLLLLFGPGSCKKQDLPEPPGGSVASVVAGDSSFSMLQQVIEKTGYAPVLRNSLALTLFAPTNAAFAASGISTSTIDTASVANLTALLQYHLLATAIVESKIPVSDTIQTLLGIRLYTNKNTNGIFVNGIPLNTQKAGAGNGLVYAIPRVLVPPSQTLQQLIEADTSLSLLNAALQKDTLYRNNFSFPGVNYTLFAPDNNALRLTDSLSSASAIANTTLERIDSLLTQYIVQTSVFTNSFVNQGTFKNIRGGTLYTTLPPAIVLLRGIPPSIDSTQQAASPLVVKDRIALNGVLHVVSKPL